MFYRKKINVIGFTLIEVIISLFLSAMVAFFVYTMMISSYNAYKKLLSVSKNANSIRFFVSSINNSVRDATDFKMNNSNKEILFTKYDKTRNCLVKEKYYFFDNTAFRVKGGGFFESWLFPTLSNYNDFNNYYDFFNSGIYSSLKLKLLKKDIIIASSGNIVETVVISNIIRSVYVEVEDKAENKYKRLQLGIVYDDAVNGKVNSTTGEISIGSASEINMKKMLLHFSFRNRDLGV